MTAGPSQTSSSGLPPVPDPLTHKYGARGTLFLVLVGVSLVVGAGIVGLALAGSGQPESIVIGFLLAAIPVGPLVAAYLWLDRYEPEPLLLLVTAFGWGALVATGAALFLQSVNAAINGEDVQFAAVVVAPIVEEAGKGLFVLLLLLLRRHQMVGILDALVYAGLVGVGFAFTENIVYIASAYIGGDEFGPGGLGSATVLFIVRGIFSPFAHPLFTSMIAIGVGLAVVSKARWIKISAPLLGYLLAVGLHAAWNGSALIGGGGVFLLTYLFAMVPGAIGLVALALVVRVHEARRLNQGLTDLARLGYVRPDEVPWFARLPARRTARRNVKARSGPAGERLMRAYQQQAIELASLHHRVQRGRAPAGSIDRGALMAHRLAVLRAHLTAPSTPAPYRRMPSGQQPDREV